MAIELVIGRRYRRGDGHTDVIGGLTKDNPNWVYSIGGDWYDKATGRRIGYSVAGAVGRRSPFAEGNWRNMVEEVTES